MGVEGSYVWVLGFNWSRLVCFCFRDLLWFDFVFLYV